MQGKAIPKDLSLKQVAHISAANDLQFNDTNQHTVLSLTIPQKGLWLVNGWIYMTDNGHTSNLYANLFVDESGYTDPFDQFTEMASIAWLHMIGTGCQKVFYLPNDNMKVSIRVNIGVTNYPMHVSRRELMAVRIADGYIQ